jgi:hypothetical protein
LFIEKQITTNYELPSGGAAPFLLSQESRGQETGEKRKLAAFSESYDDPEKSNSYLLETAVEFSI